MTNDRRPYLLDAASADKIRQMWTWFQTSERRRRPTVRRRTVAGKAGFRIVKLDATIESGSSGECTLMTGTKGEEEESDNTIECYNRFSTLDEGTIAIAAYVVNGWELIAAACAD